MERLLKGRVWKVKNRVWRDRESGRIIERTEPGKLTERREYGKITEGQSMENEEQSLETPMNGYILQRPLEKEHSLERSVKEQRLER